MPVGNTYQAIPGGLQATDKVVVFRGNETYNLTPEDVNSYVDAQAELKYLLLQAIVDTKGMTGFDNNTGITITYNHTARTITLAGTLTYYFRGTVHQLTSPWTSPAHTATETTWYLYSTDGVNFAWSTDPWTFKDIMVAAVRYRNTAAQSFALSELHGTMDWNAHDIMHKNIGTYRVSGGSLDGATYTENTASDAATTPGFNSAVIQDEDNITSLPAWPQGTYTTMYIGGSDTPILDTTALFPFISDAGQFLKVNNPTAGTMSAGINNRYYNVYQVLIPVTSDSDSQKYRMVMLQPQATYTSLAAAQAEATSGLSFGNLSFTVAEFVIWARITYVTANGDPNTGKCRIATGGVTYVVGSRAGQVNVAGFTTNSHSNLSATTLAWLLSGHTGTANRIPYFDGTGAAAEMATIPAGYLPSYVDDVVEVANYAALPGTGETGKIYVTLDTNFTYRWSGSVYVGITSDLATTIHGATSKSTPVDADELGIWDSITGFLNKLTWANLKTTLNLSGTNTGDETAARIGTIVNGATNYVTPLDADKIGIWDTLNGLFKAVTWYNLRNTLASYFVPLITDKDTITGTANLIASDNKRIVEFNSTGAFTYTINQMFDGFTCDLVNINTGDVTLAAGSGVTLRNISANRKLTSQWQGVSLYFRSATECVIIGSLDA